MELHRLSPMQDYDREVFNELYTSLLPLRNKLAYGIDHRLFGVTQQEIKSWFDDKFLYVFNKYYGQDDTGVLKGKLINSLKFFSTKILKKHYQYNNYNLYNDMISLDEAPVHIIPDESEMDNKSLILNLVMEFMKERLTEEAYLIFSLELNPPSYIASRLNNIQQRIPSKLLAQYLDLSIDSKSISKLNRLRRDIKKHLEIAIQYFQQNYQLELT